MSRQIPVGAEARADIDFRDGVHVVATDVAFKRLTLVNVILVGDPAGPGGWVLVDTGPGASAYAIARAAERRFGPDAARPRAIVVTHGHFDHVGALVELAERWDVPVYAHELEHPYLAGRASYPRPDPSVGGGMMARMSSRYPTDPVDVGSRLRALPADGSIPHLDGWRWVHTPGHSPGHVALWRERDRLLVSGDAVVSTDQESALAVLTQRAEVHGPPQYLTPDWDGAKRSVATLAGLEPNLLVTSHGPALRGATMTTALRRLATEFDAVGRPPGGVRSRRRRGGDGGAAEAGATQADDARVHAELAGREQARRP